VRKTHRSRMCKNPLPKLTFQTATKLLLHLSLYGAKIQV